MSDDTGPVKSGKFNFNEVLFKLWHGEFPLLEAFWLYYVAALFVLKVLGDVLAFLGPVFGLFEVVWAGFMVKPVFLAAAQYRGRAELALAAKGAVVVFGVFALLDSLGKIF